MKSDVIGFISLARSSNKQDLRSHLFIVLTSGFIYVSGQIPYTPENKPLSENPTIAEQAEQVIQNVSNILEASNSSLNHIVKANIFLTDMKTQFGEFNGVYAKYFSDHKPARSCVAVKELPLGVDLEMEVVAVEKDDQKL
ncbi:CIC11C00000005462 [Sungouiella intermedia]|uniref:CIC11C00000005462 n=1 Tax=Sungouiella intermedia TaxID=45354 RepID=A0A1L0BK09_9ASCO|nr:CIC11C00000005462 [[Candida] intermedia]